MWQQLVADKTRRMPDEVQQAGRPEKQRIGKKCIAGRVDFVTSSNTTIRRQRRQTQLLQVEERRAHLLQVEERQTGRLAPSLGCGRVLVLISCRGREHMELLT